MKSTKVYDNNNIVKLTSRVPADVVESTNALLPRHLKGLVIYNPERKRLESTNESKVYVYYDPIHGVLEVKY